MRYLGSKDTQISLFKVSVRPMKGGLSDEKGGLGPREMLPLSMVCEGRNLTAAGTSLLRNQAKGLEFLSNRTEKAEH